MRTIYLLILTYLRSPAWWRLDDIDTGFETPTTKRNIVRILFPQPTVSFGDSIRILINFD